MTLALRDDPTVCPECGTPLVHFTGAQPALIRGVGYGATKATTIAHCGACGWSYIPDVIEVAS